MDRYGKKIIIEPGVFREGNIVEISEDGNVMCKGYFKSEFGELQVDSGREIDIVAVVQKNTQKEQMKEIERQIRCNNFFIDKEVVDLIVLMRS